MGIIVVQSTTEDLPSVEAPVLRAVGTARGFVLTPADVKMIRRVYDYRFLHIDHLSALTGRSYKKVHGRLLKLCGIIFLRALNCDSKSIST